MVEPELPPEIPWKPLPAGGFSGTNWSGKNAIQGADPYLVWADIFRFGPEAAKVPDALSVLIELAEGTTVGSLVERTGGADLLKVSSIPLDSDVADRLRYVTAKVRPAFFKAIAAGGALAGLVHRVEIGRVRSLATGPSDTNLPMLAATPASRLKGKVLGVIDDGLAVAHVDFRDAAGRSRVAYFWQQDGQGATSAPLGYGREWTDTQINLILSACTYGGMVDESAVYSALGLSPFGRTWPDGVIPFYGLDLSAHHGTMVTSLAAGLRVLTSRSDGPDGDSPTWERATDAAAIAPIVAVQLPHVTVADTSGGTLNAHVLDGLIYILSRCAPSARIAVNISFGAHAGPHNGSSVLESAMNALCTLYRGRLKIVVAAGNSYQSRTHANMTLAPGDEQALNWAVHPDDHTESFVEIWMPAGARGVAIQVTSPGGMASPWLAPGGSCALLDGTGHVVAMVMNPGLAFPGVDGIRMFIALAPTARMDAGAPLAPSGTWKIGLRLDSSALAAVTLDAYVQRDDVIVGTHSGGRQSCFEDDFYDMDSRVDAAMNRSLIRRNGSFNSIATGARTLSVGGIRISNSGEHWARYSPRKWVPPTSNPDAARPQRPNVVNEPQREAPSDNNAALEGVLASGTRSGGYARLRGTSAAAPQITRAELDAM